MHYIKPTRHTQLHKVYRIFTNYLIITVQNWPRNGRNITLLLSQSLSNICTKWQTYVPDETSNTRHFFSIALREIATTSVVGFTFIMCWTKIWRCRVGSWFLSTSRICANAKWWELRRYWQHFELHDAWWHSWSSFA